MAQCHDVEIKAKINSFGRSYVTYKFVYLSLILIEETHTDILNGIALLFCAIHFLFYTKLHAQPESGMEGILTPDKGLGKAILSDKRPYTERNLHIHLSATNMATLHFVSIIHYGSLGVGNHSNCV